MKKNVKGCEILFCNIGPVLKNWLLETKTMLFCIAPYVNLKYWTGVGSLSEQQQKAFPMKISTGILNSCTSSGNQPAVAPRKYAHPERFMRIYRWHWEPCVTCCIRKLRKSALIRVKPIIVSWNFPSSLSRNSWQGLNIIPVNIPSWICIQ